MNAASTERHDFIAYPTNRVVGTIADAANARAAYEALLQAGFTREDIDVLHGEEALKRLDPTGAEHGFFAQFHRTLIRAFNSEEFDDLTHHVEDIEAGRFVIMVMAKPRNQRLLAADVLNRFGAEFVGFYGRWAREGLPATGPRTPEDIPNLFARAWNERDSAALAGLFDEDAEFVGVTGLCWHDRESIRKGHADALKNIVPDSTLTVDETRVKLLSPDTALVHTRMTCSTPAPRTTIVSFVVHRTANWWQCAAAYNTDVAAAAAG